MDIDKERNRIALDRITFHLNEALSFCRQLDLSGLSDLEQREWEKRIKNCKEAIDFTKQSVEKLSKILE